jgi:Ca-activated chloride channel family protein
VLRDTGARFEDASQDFKFAAAVAGFGLVLRDSPHRGSLTLAEVATWGRAGTGSDVGGYRSEFLGLVEKAQALMQ